MPAPLMLRHYGAIQICIIVIIVIIIIIMLAMTDAKLLFTLMHG